MTELEKRLTDTLSALSEQYEREQRRQAEQYEAIEKQMKRLTTQVEDLRRQQGRPVALAEDLQQQLSEFERQVELLAADYREIAAVFERGVNRIQEIRQRDYGPSR